MFFSLGVMTPVKTSASWILASHKAPASLSEHPGKQGQRPRHWALVPRTVIWIKVPVPHFRSSPVQLLQAFVE